MEEEEDLQGYMDQLDLKQAIKDGTLSDIAESLRKFAKAERPIPSEIILKLCDRLEDRLPMRIGRKANRQDKVFRNYDLAADYLYLCENKNQGFAKYVVYSEDTITLPVRGQARQNWPNKQFSSKAPPKRGKIKDKLCKLYDTSPQKSDSKTYRKFDSILADYKLMMAWNKYDILMIEGCDEEEAKRRVCAEFKIKMKKFVASLLPQ